MKILKKLFIDNIEGSTPEVIVQQKLDYLLGEEISRFSEIGIILTYIVPNLNKIYIYSNVIPNKTQILTNTNIKNIDSEFLQYHEIIVSKGNLISAEDLNNVSQFKADSMYNGSVITIVKTINYTTNIVNLTLPGIFGLNTFTASLPISAVGDIELGKVLASKYSVKLGIPFEDFDETPSNWSGYIRDVVLSESLDFGIGSYVAVTSDTPSDINPDNVVITSLIIDQNNNDDEFNVGSYMVVVPGQLSNSTTVELVIDNCSSTDGFDTGSYFGINDYLELYGTFEIITDQNITYDAGFDTGSYFVA